MGMMPLNPQPWLQPLSSVSVIPEALKSNKAKFPLPLPLPALLHPKGGLGPARGPQAKLTEQEAPAEPSRLLKVKPPHPLPPPPMTRFLTSPAQPPGRPTVNFHWPNSQV